jgi:hypothetical protein
MKDLWESIWKIDHAMSLVTVKREYVLLAGSPAAGLLLSQIVFWHHPTKEGKSRLRVKRSDLWWVAKTAREWRSECFLTEWEFRVSLLKLKEIGLIETRIMKFSGVSQLHIRLIPESLMSALHALAV